MDFPGIDCHMSWGDPFLIVATWGFICLSYLHVKLLPHIQKVFCYCFCHRFLCHLCCLVVFHLFQLVVCAPSNSCWIYCPCSSFVRCPWVFGHWHQPCLLTPGLCPCGHFCCPHFGYKFNSLGFLFGTIYGLKFVAKSLIYVVYHVFFLAQVIL